ncbi:MAG: hypothetical protein M1840_002285 [Geoglossum simile]|nr:MAG: hypothetical protein M1840_002285 [Geoglossum simile]
MDTSTERCRESAESSSLFYTESAPGREAIFPDSTHTQPDIQRVVGSSPKCEIPAPSHGIALAGEKRKQPDTQQTAGNASKRIKTAVRCSSVGDSESLRSCASVPRSKPKSFRIAGIPSNWTQHDLLVALRTIDPDFNHRSHQLSLYPACCGHTQTSLVCLDTCTKYFQSLEPNEYKYERVYDTVNKTVADLVFDCHFYDLTPLNKPKGEIVADVVAVTGLAGHAFGSWRSRETQRMWLKDFLPKHVMGIRVMTYGYDSSLVGHTRSRSVLSDYRRNFIQQLENSRSSSESRPIIFLGHSMGGILILQTLVESKRNPRYQHILDSTRGIFFFGTPHQGLRINELKEMIDTEAGGEESRVNLLKQLDEGSEFLETQKEDLLRVWGEFQGKIFSFYETVKTSTVRKLESGKYERGGPEVMMVKNFSSKIYLPYEYRLPVEKNHTDMVKFASEVDTTFQTVVKHMKDCIASTPTPKMLLSAIDRVKLDQFLKMLLKVDQEEYRSTIQSLDCNDPKFYWIFRNVNFRHWRSANHPQVLWLSGPPKCQIHQVSSYIVDSGKALEKQRPVLYFFCSTATGKKPIVTTFVHTLLHQFIQFSPVDKKIWIVRNFLRALLERELASSPTLSHLKSEDSLDTTIKTILDASTNGLWYALKSVLADEQNSELWVVIDGLDEAEHQKGKFVRDVHTFVMHLEGISKVRALLTSRPQAEINEIFNGLPCIEYDKERKEYLASLHFDNIRYGKISEEHKDSLGWLWTHNQYTTWSASDVSRLLYIQGKPGSGKSTLTKYFKDNLLKRESEAKSATVASFFYSYREGALQTSHSNMLRSILYDILYQNEFFFYHFQFEYRRYWVSLRERGHGDLTKWPYELLKRTLSSIGDHLQAERLYLIIDAVDESDDEDRRDILRLLFDLCSKQKRCIVKVFVASRPVVQLEHQIAKFHNIIRLQDETKQDISSFTQSFLRPLLFTDFLDRATQYIVEHAQGVFLWVQLVKGELAGYVEEGASENDIFEFLRGLPTELEDLYEHMLGKLENNKRGLEHGIKMIRFVLFVRRPLAVDELRHALGIPDNPDTEYTPSDEDFQRSIPAKPGESHEIDPMVQRIIHCGGNFLETKGDHGTVMSYAKETP